MQVREGKTSLLATTKKELVNLNLYLDFDRNKNTFYNNVYLKDFDYVIKIPISEIEKTQSSYKIKIEKFNLAKYTYLLDYD
ncbi:MAG: hypothetical protein GF317_16100 [Candidatus Lokiarchaeota archaeon]|nr:hypothetical protein [Candidatus Lokiarchaeota archaeon]MBD3201057.1 hypothetical protein [Candidatus Lokiarchaeota archaeon]